MMPEASALESRSRLVTFGPFAFDPQRRLLSRNGAEIPLPPRVLAVLELLISRPGDVVPRQDLLDRVWKDAFVTDTSLAEAISFLRQALGDDPQAPRYIQTVHRRGYRFLSPLTTQDHPQAAPDLVAPEAIKPSIGRELLPWSVAVVCGVLAITAVWRLVGQPAADPPPVVRFQIRPSPGTSFDRRAPALAIAPDGRTIVWSACENASSACALFVRPLDRLDAVRLRGTDGALAPFLSPDGRWIGFFADGKLKKIAVSGGAPTTLTDAPVPGGASWSDDGRIVFADRPAGGLMVVSDQGGALRMITQPRVDRGELRHAWPSWLPGGRGVLFTIVGSPVAEASGTLAVLPQPASAWRALRAGIARGVPAGRGYLLFSTPTDLQAQVFDETSLTVAGEPDGVLEGLAPVQESAQFAANDSGALVALNRAGRERQFSWADEPGRALGGLARLSDISIAPDGRRAAGVVADAAGSDIWTVDLDRGATNRLTYGGTNASPVWTPDGRVLFASRSSGPFAVSVAHPGTGGAQVVSRDDSHLFPTGAAADGRLVIARTQKDGRVAMGVAPRPDAKPVMFDDGPFDETDGTFSPDGAWLAFASDESGRWEIYVRHLTGTRRVPVSAGGGERPSWSADGRWIYFHDGRRLLRAAFNARGTPPAGTPEVLFDRPGARVVAVAPDGRLLVEQEDPADESATVVLQWLREVRQRLRPPVTAPR